MCFEQNKSIEKSHIKKEEGDEEEVDEMQEIELQIQKSTSNLPFFRNVNLNEKKANPISRYIERTNTF